MKGMMTMGLRFRNSTSETVFVAYAYPNFNCTPINYATIGYYRIEPGQTREVWRGHAGGNTFFTMQRVTAILGQGTTIQRSLMKPSISAGTATATTAENLDFAEFLSDPASATLQLC